MAEQSVGPCPPSRWRPSRPGALAMAVVMLMTACATGGAPGPAARMRPLTVWNPPELGGVEPGGGGGGREAVFARLPTDFAPVRVSASELTEALGTLWLDVPLRMAMPRSPLYVGRRLALADAPDRAEAWRSELGRAYGHYCEARGTPGDCLSLLEDGPRFQEDDKRRLALALAVEPALVGIRAELRATLDPTRALTMLSLGIAGYLALLLAPVPEPVTKSLALAFTVLMWGYLGWEFFEVLRAYAQLADEAPRAESFARLREMGERFGKVLGPNSVRILVLVGTAAIGETVSLASRVPRLPGFGQASATVAARTGVNLMDATMGAERAIVSVSEGSLRLVMAPHVMAMVGRGPAGGGSVTSRGRTLSSGHRAWGSFSGFKSAMGPAGAGSEWHHIVEQTPGNVRRFGGEALHNTENVVRFGKALHHRVSSIYSMVRVEITGSFTLTIRQWLASQPYEAQFEFGLRAMENVRNGVW